MSDPGEHTNRLAGESSPYLRLHAHNPVDWYPWGEEALARARAEDRPIFLSVGYSTCYWCHVMERESFSSEAVAELMNRDFVNIKLDREERPDLDEIYMSATQILTGQGGWPNSVFLTPDLKPFFAGTYFPPDDRHGRPGFPRVLHSMAEAWRGRRQDVEAQAESVARAVRHHLEERAAPGETPPSAAVAQRSLDDLRHRFDRQWGGFGDAPKFPTPSNLLLLEEFRDEQPEAADMLAATLDQMARGGLYDQLGGGFHRYATDREWKVPHFEKMLYDNGLLLELYARRWRHAADRESARIVRESAAWLEREMLAPDGSFWSAQDAETDGMEGAFYVWTREELKEVLGEEDFGFMAPLYGFDGPPFFEGSHYVLHLPVPLARQAAARRMALDALLEQMAPLRARLLETRGRRPRPATDQKVLADWNGMAIAGLAAAGRHLPDERLVALAAGAAETVLSALRGADGTLLHVRRGEGGIPAFLSDYVFLVRGLLALHRATGEESWLARAAELTDEQDRRLGDPAGGFFVAAESPDVLVRSKEVFDGAVPSGNGVAVLNLLELAERTGEPRWSALAAAALRAFAPLLERFPEGTRLLALAARHHARARPGGEEATAPGTGDALSSAARVTVGGEAEAADADGWRRFELRLEVAPGWHLYAHDAAGEGLVRTEVRGEGAEIADLSYPSGQAAAGIDGEGPAVYEGQVRIRGKARFASGAPARLAVAFQACAEDRCLAPATAEVVF